jgi:putative membrane protein
MAARSAINPRHVLVALVVNALVLALVIAVLPGLRFDPTRPVLAAAFLAAAYGLLKAYVKPVLQFLTLKYLFATYGLVTIVINALLLWVLALISFDSLQYSGVLPLLVGGALAGLLGMLLESMFGLTPPVLDARDEKEPA